MRKYGWQKDRGTNRALDFASSIQVMPAKFSWRQSLPPVFDQGKTASCTGQAVAAAIMLDELRDGVPPPRQVPSRKFIYWNGRAATQGTPYDAGARISDVVDSLSTRGYCPESLCPFENMTEAPTHIAFETGLAHLVGNRRNVVQSERGIKQAIMAGRVVIAGMLAYETFEKEDAAATGIVRLPKDNEQYLGGHCVCIVGWDDEYRFWEVRNSWGPGWGDQGHFWADYAYFVNPQLSSDLTTIF